MAKSLYFTNRKRDYENKNTDFQVKKQESYIGPRILFGFSAIAIMIILIIIIDKSNLISEISQIFKNNLDGVSFWSLKGNIGGGIVFSIYITLFFLSLNAVISLKRINIPLLISIFFISLIIFSGIFIIQDLMGTKKLELNLNPDGYGLGKINCGDPNNMILVGDAISCTLENKNIIYSGMNITFIHINQSKSYAFLGSKNDTFYVPEKLRYIYFEVTGTTYSFNISSGFPYRFKTFEEYEKDKPVFLAYILSLIILAFVTVPSAVLNIRKLIFKKD
jgi:hypothetical protein